MATKNAVAVNLESEIMQVEQTFNEVLSDKQMKFAREAEFALQILYGKGRDFLRNAAIANPQSLKESIVNVAAIGLSLNPAMKLAYLVPRDGVICLDISYMGLVHLATDTGAVRWAHSELVREKDEFHIVGVDVAPQHKYKPFSTDRGNVVGVYVTAKTRDGDYLTETMTIAEAHAIRDRSTAWSKNKSGPWKTDEGEMIRKTVVKRASKMWPKSERLDRAVDYLNNAGGEGIPFAGETVDVTATEVETFDLDHWTERLMDAKTSDEVGAIKIEGYERLKIVKDAEAYRAFKAAANARGKELLAAETERQPGEEG